MKVMVVVVVPDSEVTGTRLDAAAAPAWTWETVTSSVELPRTNEAVDGAG